jgi:hypothetical protein
MAVANGMVVHEAELHHAHTTASGCASGLDAEGSHGSGVDVQQAELQHDPMAVASGVAVHVAELQHAHTAASGWASGLDAKGSHGSGMDVQQAELRHDHMAMCGWAARCAAA